MFIKKYYIENDSKSIMYGILPWGCFLILLILSIVLFSGGKSVPNYIVILGIVFLSLCVIVPIWLSIKPPMKEVDKKEFLEYYRGYKTPDITKLLMKYGFSEEEIKSILKNRPTSQESKLKNNPISQESNENEISVPDYEEDDEMDKEVSNITYDEMPNELLTKKFGLKNNFNITNKMLTKSGLGILVDSKLKEIAFRELSGEIKYLKFNQINSYSVLQDERGAGNGAMAFATLTGNDSLYKLGMANTLAGNKYIYAYEIQVVLNGVDDENVDIFLLTKKVSSNSNEYSNVIQTSKQITTFFDKIISNSNNGNSSDLDELKKLKELLDMGAITKEEFEEKKKNLLK